MLARFICKRWRVRRSGKIHLTSSIFQLPFKGKWLAASPRNVKHIAVLPTHRGTGEDAARRGVNANLQTQAVFSLPHERSTFLLRAFLSPQGMQLEDSVPVPGDPRGSLRPTPP